MNAPSTDIKEMLDDDSNVDTTSFVVNIATLDESKINSASILDYAGRPPQLTMDRAKYEIPSIQVLVKCVDYEAGWAFISSVVDSLHGRSHEIVNGTYYSLIECLNGPSFLKRENQRTVFVANFMVQRRDI